MESILDKFLAFLYFYKRTILISFAFLKLRYRDSILEVVRTSSHHARRYILNTA